MLNRSKPYYYLAGEMPLDVECYVERAIDRELLDFFIEVHDLRLAFILAPRQMGKTSLIRKLKKRINEKKIAVYVETDFQGYGEVKSEEILYNNLLKHIVEQSSQGIEYTNLNKKINSIMENKKQISSALKFQDCLKYILEFIDNKKIIIFIDEVQYLLDWGLQNIFFSMMRGIAQRDENLWNNLKFVLVGVMNPNDLITSSGQIFNKYKLFEMTNISNCEPLWKGLLEVISSPAQAAKVVEVILRFTGGKPYLTQYFCESILIQGQNKKLDLNNESNFEQNLKDIFNKKVIPELMEKDPQHHIMSIKNRFLLSERNLREKIKALTLYQQLLTNPIPIDWNESYEQKELIISGLAIRDGNTINIACPIYSGIFDIKWTQRIIEIITQKLECAMSEKIERDYVLIIDRSPSMNRLEPDGRSRWETIEEFVCDSLAKKMSEIDLDGMVVYFFSGKSHRFDENITPSFVKSLFRDLGIGGTGTNLASVLKDALDDYFQRQDAGLIKKDGEWILIVTDGDWTVGSS
ncbi:MAG: AAA-like domain-containing protein [Microcystaceae cyanobacterium]